MVKQSPLYPKVEGLSLEVAAGKMAKSRHPSNIPQILKIKLKYRKPCQNLNPGIHH